MKQTEAKKGAGKTFLVTLLLPLVVGIWDVLAVAEYMRSTLQSLAEGEGFDKVCTRFHPTEGGTLLISYEIFVKQPQKIE